MFRFIDTGIGSAKLNMAVDEVLLSNFHKTQQPIFRIYQWKPSLSFGRFSKIDKNIKIENLDKISYARRITGGGILVHGDDISYTLILPKKFIKDMGVKKSYQYLCGFLLSFYKKLSLQPKFAIDLNLETGSSEICLAGCEPYDITINNMKIGGNAQRYSKNTIFLHGTIPIKFNEELFTPLFINDSGVQNAASLCKLGVDKSYEELKEILIKSFCETFNCELFYDELLDIEKEDVKKLLEEKYNLKRWNIDGKINTKKA